MLVVAVIIRVFMVRSGQYQALLGVLIRCLTTFTALGLDTGATVIGLEGLLTSLRYHMQYNTINLFIEHEPHLNVRTVYEKCNMNAHMSMKAMPNDAHVSSKCLAKI